VLVRSAIGQFEGYIKLNKKIPPEVLTSISAIDDAARLADTMAAHMPLKLEDKQKVLEIARVRAHRVSDGHDGVGDRPAAGRETHPLRSRSRWRRASASTTSTSR
jgi:hypothetical protein